LAKFCIEAYFCSETEALFVASGLLCQVQEPRHVVCIVAKLHVRSCADFKDYYLTNVSGQPFYGCSFKGGAISDRCTSGACKYLVPVDVEQES
jgi:hypothetical protein